MVNQTETSIGAPSGQLADSFFHVFENSAFEGRCLHRVSGILLEKLKEYERYNRLYNFSILCIFSSPL
mgnify:CR=1 FL=1